MKLTLLTLLVIAGISCAYADLPKTVVVGTDEVSSSKFKPWKESDPVSYCGQYSGDIGGDTAGKLNLKIKKSGEKYYSHSASGVYRNEYAGPKPTIIDFKNGHFSNDDSPMVQAGPVQIFFVLYQGKKGVVIGGAFIPKE